MKDYTAEVRKQMLELWGKTIGQLEEISKGLMSTTGLEKLKFDQARLVEERDRLLKRLGEEVFRLLEAGALVVPAPVLPIYQRLKKVFEKLLDKQPAGRAKAVEASQAVRKTARKKPAAKKPARKKAVGKKPARKKAARKKSGEPKPAAGPRTDFGST